MRLQIVDPWPFLTCIGATLHLELPVGSYAYSQTDSVPSPLPREPLPFSLTCGGDKNGRRQPEDRERATGWEANARRHASSRASNPRGCQNDVMIGRCRRYPREYGDMGPLVRSDVM